MQLVTDPLAWGSGARPIHSTGSTVQALEVQTTMTACPCPYRIEYHAAPGRDWSDDKIAVETKLLRGLAASCFNGAVPEYQCLLGTRECLENKVIAIARSTLGGEEILGFTSAVVFDVPGVPDPIFHTGLTCVAPRARKLGLVRALVTTLLVHYLARSSRPWRPIWVTNVAPVVSSLGTFASTFDNVYPSPQHPDTPPSETHVLIARHFAANWDRIAIPNPHIEFDEAQFVFRGGVRGTMFSKEKGANPHRSSVTNDFFERRLDFHRDDVMIQVGRISLPSFGWKGMWKLWPLSLLEWGARSVTSWVTGRS
jgi:hypothetical protein